MRSLCAGLSVCFFRHAQDAQPNRARVYVREKLSFYKNKKTLAHVAKCLRILRILRIPYESIDYVTNCLRITLRMPAHCFIG